MAFCDNIIFHLLSFPFKNSKSNFPLPILADSVRISPAPCTEKTSSSSEPTRGPVHSMFCAKTAGQTLGHAHATHSRCHPHPKSLPQIPRQKTFCHGVAPHEAASNPEMVLVPCGTQENTCQYIDCVARAHVAAKTQTQCHSGCACVENQFYCTAKTRSQAFQV